MRASRIASALAAVLLLYSPSSNAQDTWDGPPPAHLAVVDGDATVGRDVNREEAMPGVPIVPGDVVRTDRGRAQIIFPDASIVDLDEFSTFELLSSSAYRLSEGRLLLSIPDGSSAGSGRLSLETPQAAVEIDGPGEYRLAMAGTPSGLQTVVDVLRGHATLYNERGSTVLRSGEQSIAYDAAAPTYARSFNTRQVDALSEWSVSVRGDRGSGLSAQYLPSDLRSYSSVLDRNGSWAYEAPYGYVWYPSVGADWRPYGDGYWSSMPAFGWTWIGASRWSWPTHHYGRWGYQRSRWYWIPDRRWSPAWVSWGAAPGYVSWSPLGYDNRPVFGLSVSTGYGGGWGAGWTVIDRNYFGGPRWNVRQYGMRNTPARTPFRLQAAAPPTAGGYSGRWSAGAGSVGRVNSSAGYGASRPRTGSGVAGGGSYNRDNDRGGSYRTARPTVPSTTAIPSSRPLPRAVPRSDAAAPSVIYSSPPSARRDGSPRAGRTRPESQGRSVESAPPPAAATPSAESGRPRYRDNHPSAVPPATSPSAGDDGRSRQPRGASGSVGRAVPRGERSGNGGQSSGQASSSGGGSGGGNGGGRAQGRRR